MAYEQLCMYCFENRGGESICPHCGRDSRAAVPQIQMLPGSLVYHDRFLVGRALGQDATGIVYSAFDTKKENKLRLREYLPRDCAERLNDGSVVPVAGLEDQFDKGLRKLRASVEGVEDPRKRHFFFEENGTAYIAQRKSAAAAAAASGRYHDEDDMDDGEEGGAIRRVGLIVGICAVLVALAAGIIIWLVNGVLSGANDVTQTPTLNPNAAWAPEVTASPTPYVAPTFGALVDPEQSWMDYTYAGDVDKEFNQQQSEANRATPTPRPTTTPEASVYKTVSAKSSPQEIRTLQQRLVTLGWLQYDRITGAYDASTVQAVKDFQQYVNETYPSMAEQLDVDGIAGPKTQQWLYGVEATRPTPAPTPIVTPKPDDFAVTPESSKTDILAMQRKLIFLGCMERGTDDGVYGTSTVAGVKRFQQHVNALQGFDVLQVTGTMDSQSMAFLNYYVAYWESIQQATQAPEVTATPQPAATPTPIPDMPEDNFVVDQNSAKESIQGLQAMLIRVGLLPEGSDDGIYGSATVAAVARFQEWVNGQIGANLSINGVADSRTLGYLEMVSDNGMSVVPTQAPTGVPMAEPTTIPTVEPTTVPTVEPTAVPTAEPTEEPGINAGSDREAIQRMQTMLIRVGLLSEGAADGIYGSGTANAVSLFQKAVNERFGEGTVVVSGVCDAATLAYLEQFSEDGISVAPTQRPTEKPSVSALTLTLNGIAAGADPVTVNDDGVMIAWHAEGSVDSYYVYVYNVGGTAVYSDEATGNTQLYVSARDMEAGMTYTAIVAALPVGGGQEDMVKAEGRFILPSEAVEPDPTGKPQLEVLIAVNGANAVGQTVEITSGKTIAFNWGASAAVSSYSVWIADEQNVPVISNEETNIDNGKLNVSDLKPGVMYTITVGAKPVGGTDDDIVYATGYFTIPVPATAVPTAEPTPVPTPEVTEAPRPGVIESLMLSINGNMPNGVMEITGDTVELHWMAKGELQGYSAVITNSSGTRIAELLNTAETGSSFSVSMLEPGEVYTVTVIAVPVNGTEADAVTVSGSFTVPAQPTPEPTAEPTAEPTVAPVGTPRIDIDAEAYSKDGKLYLTGDSATFRWSAEGEIQFYRVILINSNQETLVQNDTVETSMTTSLSELMGGIYQLQVGAVPAGARSEADIVWSSMIFAVAEPEPEATPVPTPEPVVPVWPTTLDKNSSAEQILMVQMKLSELGFIQYFPEGYMATGAWDEPTLMTIAAFQQFMNETYDANLPGIDPMNPDSVIDPMTLAALEAATIESITPGV